MKDVEDLEDNFSEEDLDSAILSQGGALEIQLETFYSNNNNVNTNKNINDFEN